MTHYLREVGGRIGCKGRTLMHCYARKALIGAAIAFAGLAASQATAAPNLVADPSFELNDGSWDSTSADIGIAAVGPGGAHTGTYAAVSLCVGSGCVNTQGAGAFMRQTLTTTPGETYTLSFFVAESSGPTSEFTVFWDGVLIADVLNPASNSIPILPLPYVEFTYANLVASTGATVLEVHGRQDPAAIYFDDFSVAAADAIPEPATLALLGMALVGLGAARAAQTFGRVVRRRLTANRGG